MFKQSHSGFLPVTIQGQKRWRPANLPGESSGSTQTSGAPLRTLDLVRPTAHLLTEMPCKSVWRLTSQAVCSFERHLPCGSDGACVASVGHQGDPLHRR